MLKDTDTEQQSIDEPHDCSLIVCYMLLSYADLERLIGIFSEMCFQRLYWGNRLRWFLIWYCQKDVINVVLFMAIK